MHDCTLVRKMLLVCGILSSLVFLAAVLLGATQWPGYSSITQYVSELSAIGAPSRPLMIPLLLASDVLVIAFGIGVWVSAGPKRTTRILASLLMGYGLVCLTAPLTPMHPLGTEKTLTDVLHIATTVLDLLFIFLILGFGSSAHGRGFRLYSIATILTILASGTLIGLDESHLGIWERINIGAFLLWVAALAVGFLRTQTAGTGEGKAITLAR